MAETSELHQKVDKILKRVESMDNFMPWLVRPQATAIKGELIKFFNRRKRAIKVYLAIDGNRAVSDIAQFINIAQPNVSTEIKTLMDYGLVEPVIVGKNTVYRKNKIDKLIGLSKDLEAILQQDNKKEGKDVTEFGDPNLVEDIGSNQQSQI